MINNLNDCNSITWNLITCCQWTICRRMFSQSVWWIRRRNLKCCWIYLFVWTEVGKRICSDTALNDFCINLINVDIRIHNGTHCLIQSVNWFCRNNSTLSMNGVITDMECFTTEREGNMNGIGMLLDWNGSSLLWCPVVSEKSSTETNNFGWWFNQNWKEPIILIVSWKTCRNETVQLDWSIAKMSLFVFVCHMFPMITIIWDIMTVNAMFTYIVTLVLA